MHAIDAAKVLDNALIAGVLLLAVAAGMIVHSLRYRSQTVTWLTYFLAFVTLAIGEVTAFSLAALIPLAVSLLYIAHRNQWSRFAVFGLVATYATGHAQGHRRPAVAGAGALPGLLARVRGLRPDPRRPWLLPLNSLGFLALSGVKWSHAAPDSMWISPPAAPPSIWAAPSSAPTSGRWRAAVTFNAALATAAILLKLQDQWMAVGLAVLAEVYYLAGVRFRSAFLRTSPGAVRMRAAVPGDPTGAELRRAHAGSRWPPRPRSRST